MSMQDSRDQLQDSLDNIVVEDDFNQSDEDLDSIATYARIGDNGDKSFQDDDFDEDDLEEGSKDKDERGDEASAVLHKICLKNKSIFKMISRQDYNLNKSEEHETKKHHSKIKLNTAPKREILNYSRREKSLEELSKKFLSLFLDKRESLLSLDKITNQLGVERRRIYDIINILESLKLVSRKGKNNYKWNGFECIYDTITYYDSKVNCNTEDIEITSEQYQKREKSLEMLSIGFLKLFLHFKKTMTLEEAARRLSCRTIDDHKIKTKIRRLYDIANVFKSLGLIQKTSLADTKKPAFCWVGVSGLDQFAFKIMHEKEDIDQESCNIINNLTLSGLGCLNLGGLSNLNNPLILQQLQQFQQQQDKDKILQMIQQQSSQLLMRLSNSLLGMKSNNSSLLEQQQLLQQQILQQQSTQADGNATSGGSSSSNSNNNMLNGLIIKCLQNMLQSCMSKINNMKENENKSTNKQENINIQNETNSESNESTPTSKQSKSKSRADQKQSTKMNSKKQSSEMEVQDENVPFTSMMNSSNCNLSSSQLQKTPVLKRPLTTIIHPKIDEEYDENVSLNNQATPSPSFSQPRNSLYNQDQLLTDKTNILQNMNNTNNKCNEVVGTNKSTIGCGFNSSSSFKKIKKLSYDKSADKQTENAQQLSQSQEQAQQQQQSQQQEHPQPQQQTTQSNLLNLLNYSPLLQTKLQELFTNRRSIERYY